MPELGVDVYNLSMSDLFSLTPKINDIMTYCGHRRIHGRKFDNVSFSFSDRIFVLQPRTQECYNNFHMKKFLLQNFVCYSFKHKFPSMTTRIQYFLNMPKLIFLIGIRPKYVTNKMMFNIDDDELPYTSSMWSSTVLMQKQGLYTVSYAKYIHHVLPKPFDDYGYYSSALMRHVKECTNYKLKRLKQLESPENVITPPSNRFYSKIQSDDFIRVRNECIQLYKGGVSSISQGDQFNTYVTVVNRRKSLHQKSMVEFTFLCTNHPLVVSEFRPMKSSFSLFLEIGSAISICFGLSIIDCNPFTLLLIWLREGRHNSIEEKMNSLNQRMETIELELATIDRVFLSDRIDLQSQNSVERSAE